MGFGVYSVTSSSPPTPSRSVSGPPYPPLSGKAQFFRALSRFCCFCLFLIFEKFLFYLFWVFLLDTVLSVNWNLWHLLYGITVETNEFIK